LEEIEGKYIVHSLGNFAFRQPDRYWTQRSFAFASTITKDQSGTKVTSYQCIPVHAGFQPQFVKDENEAARILERIRALSPQSLAIQASR
jgi:poly-gamma-glutamate capsule biosynthesis protein CapA/YwtB (metallophosphatase superfamily)